MPRTYRTLFLVILSAFAVLLVTQCGEGGDTKEGAGSGTPDTGGQGGQDGGTSGSDVGGQSGTIISDRTTVIDDATAAKATVEADRIIFPSSGNDYLLNKQSGDILVSGYRNGFLRGVRSAYEDGSKIVVLTTQASLNEAVIRGGASGNLDLTNVQGKILPLLAGPKSVGLSQGVDIGGTELCGEAECGATVTISQGHITFDPKVDVSLRIEDQKLKQFKAVAIGELDVALAVKAVASKSVKSSKKVTVWESEPKVFVQMIGVVPVVEVVTLSLEAGFEVSADAKATFEAGAQAGASVSAGAMFENGTWTAVEEQSLTFEPIGPTLDMKAGMKIRGYLKPKLDLMFYAVAGPSLAIEPYLSLAGVLIPSPPSWSLKAGVTGEFSGKIEVLDYTFAEYKKTLFNYEKEIAHGGGSQTDGGYPDSGYDGGSSPCEPNCPTSEMVSVPAGSFKMGCNNAVDNECVSNENPYHSVSVPAFKIDKFEVSMADYSKCVDYGPCTHHFDDDTCYIWDGLTNQNTGTLQSVFRGPSRPVVCISWEQAKEYCAWVGKRIPSEAEWEKAARGTDGRKYPWGNSPAVSCDYAVMEEVINGTTSGPGCGSDATMDVGSKPLGVSQYGAEDMVGNVSEFVEDWYHDSYVGAPADGSAWNARDGTNPYHLVRGGDFMSTEEDIRASVREMNSFNLKPGELVSAWVGFRCAVAVADSGTDGGTPTDTGVTDSGYDGGSKDGGMLDTGYDGGSKDGGTPDSGPSDTGSRDAGCVPNCSGKCGGQDSCGGNCPDNCIAPQTCGGGGVQNVCGKVPSCGPSTSGIGSDVCYVPEGPFMMGCNDAIDSNCSQFPGETPYHQVTIGTDFKIDKYEVTASDYVACVISGGCTAADTGSGCNHSVAGKENNPINCVDWYQAKVYCAWTGKRLPTEAEWEKSARGTNGQLFPWGSNFSCDFAVCSADWCSSSGTAAVGTKPAGASPYGAEDMSGNVWEWVEDDYHDTYSGAPIDGSALIDSPRGSTRVTRGGSWTVGIDWALRTSMRNYRTLTVKDKNLGFRCVDTGCVLKCSGKCGGSDGCGGTCTDACVPPQTCGGGGTTNVCGCTPNCSGKCGGDDGCGGTCQNNCVAPKICGGGGTPNVCGTIITSCGPSATGRGGDMCDVSAGPFMMGCNSAVDTECRSAENPYHSVSVPSFKIDKYEVTAAEYKACVGSGGCTAADTASKCNYNAAGKESHPINCVDWSQAEAYCTWAGKRLPTEAEWEKAARGTDGWKYPWGNAVLDCNRAVHSVSPCSNSGTAVVGSKPTGVSPYGAMDMVGNVWEWVEDDWHDTFTGAPADGTAWVDAPRGTYRVKRGGSWYYWYDSYAQRASSRVHYDPTHMANTHGFRCAAAP